MIIEETRTKTSEEANFLGTRVLMASEIFFLELNLTKETTYTVRMRKQDVKPFFMLEKSPQRSFVCGREDPR